MSNKVRILVTGSGLDPSAYWYNSYIGEILIGTVDEDGDFRIDCEDHGNNRDKDGYIDSHHAMIIGEY